MSRGLPLSASCFNCKSTCFFPSLKNRLMRPLCHFPIGIALPKMFDLRDMSGNPGRYASPRQKILDFIPDKILI